MEQIDRIGTTDEDVFEGIRGFSLKPFEVGDELRILPGVPRRLVPRCQDVLPKAKRGTGSCASLFRHDGVTLRVPVIDRG